MQLLVTSSNRHLPQCGFELAVSENRFLASELTISSPRLECSSPSRRATGAIDGLTCITLAKINIKSNLNSKPIIRYFVIFKEVFLIACLPTEISPLN